MIKALLRTCLNQSHLAVIPASAGIQGNLGFLSFFLDPLLREDDEKRGIKTLMNARTKTYVIIFLGYLLCHPLMALKIEITQGSVAPDPIAIVPFCDESGHFSDLGKKIASVIGNDLESSGLFKLITNYVQTGAVLKKDGPRFDQWRKIQSRFLVYGTIQVEWGKVTVNFYLYDVNTGSSMLALSMSGDEKKWRKVAHMVADKIYERITNEMGYFNTMVVYVEPLPLVGKGKNREVRTRLVRMDYDGENMKALTDGSEHIINPVYSPDGNWIIYGVYTKTGIKTYIMQIHEGSKRLLGNFEMLNFAARFAPNSHEVALSLVKNGKSAIHLMDTNSSKAKGVTPFVSLDTSPCFSPDGSQIVFTSDRHGKEGIYIMDRNGENVRRITFGGGKYSQPVWSPRGDYIAFVKQDGQFFIGVIRPDGTEERYITSGYLVERPSWSPNGRVIMYSYESGPNGKSYIYQVDVTGRHVRQVPTRGNGFDATWSPLYK